jgi:hypothetical protein
MFRNRAHAKARGWVLAGLAALALLTVAVAPAGASTPPGPHGLTAGGIRIGDHSAFVRAVVDFAGGSLIDSLVEATDPNPLDGAARLRLGRHVRTRVRSRSAYGITVELREQGDGLAIDVRAAQRRFKYLSYAVVGSNRLAIDVWKSGPPSRAAEVRRGSRGCLTLGTVRAQPGSVSASGGERYVFENRVLVIVRSQDGRRLGQFSATATHGRWSAQVGYRTGRAQSGTLEALSVSAKDGALACLVQARVGLRPASTPAVAGARVGLRPASTPAVAAPRVRTARARAANPAGTGFSDTPHSQRFGYGSRCPAAPANRYLTAPAGCLTVRLADVDGDGKVDLVLLYTEPGGKNYVYRFTLKVVRASGGVLTTRLPEGDIPAAISRLRNVNGRPGVEIFVHFVHVSTAESVAVYSFGSNRLQLSGELSYGGYDAGLRFGFTCHTAKQPTIVQDDFSLSAAPSTWRHTATTYRWASVGLQKAETQTTTFIGTSAPRSEVGVHC